MPRTDGHVHDREVEHLVELVRLLQENNSLRAQLLEQLMREVAELVGTSARASA